MCTKRNAGKPDSSLFQVSAKKTSNYKSISMHPITKNTFCNVQIINCIMF